MCVFTRGVSSHHVLTQAFGDAYFRREKVRHATFYFAPDEDVFNKRRKVENVKVKYIQFIVFSVTLFMAYLLHAAHVDGNWEFEVTSESDATCCVTRYNGSASSVSIPSKLSYPEEYEDEDGEKHIRYRTYYVTALGSAFRDNKNILLYHCLQD